MNFFSEMDKNNLFYVTNFERVVSMKACFEKITSSKNFEQSRRIKNKKLRLLVFEIFLLYSQNISQIFNLIISCNIFAYIFNGNFLKEHRKILHLFKR